VKSSPLQQAQSSAASNDSNTNLNVAKPIGLGLNRSASILSQASQTSESGSSKARNTVKGLMGRDWLGRSKSQPRLALNYQESHVSIRSDRSSFEDRARSPPNSSSNPKVPIPSTILITDSLVVTRKNTVIHVNRFVQCLYNRLPALNRFRQFSIANNHPRRKSSGRIDNIIRPRRRNPRTCAHPLWSALGKRRIS